MIVNRSEHPNVELRHGAEDERVHIFNQFGEAWCQTDTPPDHEDDVITPGSTPVDDDPDGWEWCDDCRTSGVEEGVLIHG